MEKNLRFGMRMKLPSTVAIKHELRMMMLAERIEALKREAAETKSEEEKYLGPEASSRLLISVEFDNA